MAIRLTADRTEINADGQDVSVLTVEVLDKEGRAIPTAHNKISFKVTGEGALIGVGNGDPNCQESDKEPERSLFNGLAQAIVQSTRTPGTITVEAYCKPYPRHLYSPYARDDHHKESRVAAERGLRREAIVQRYDHWEKIMPKSRREFLLITPLAILSTTALSRLHAQNQTQLPPGAPTAYGAGAAFGPEVSTTTFAKTKKLVQFPLTDSERAMAAASRRKTLPPLSMNGAPVRGNSASKIHWHPRPSGTLVFPAWNSVTQHDRFVRSNASATLPTHRDATGFPSRNFPAGWKAANSPPSALHASISIGLTASLPSCGAPSLSRAIWHYSQQHKPAKYIGQGKS